jgi:hypothetical protein
VALSLITLNLTNRANPKTIQDKFLVGYQGWCVQASLRCKLVGRPGFIIAFERLWSGLKSRTDDGTHILSLVLNISFTGSPVMEMASPWILITMGGCTGLINRSQMVDAPIQIYGQMYLSTPHPSCTLPQVSKTEMENKCFSSPRATRRR